MPPKAKEKDERGAEEAGPSSEEKDNLAEKELMVAFLRNKLGRYQNAGEQLAVDNLKLSDELKAWKGNAHDITAVLTSEVKVLRLANDALLAEVASLQQQVDDVKKQYEAERVKLYAQRQEEVEEMARHQNDHHQAMQQTHDFLVNKDQITAELAQLRQRVVDMDNEHQRAMTDKERKHMAALDRLRKDAEARVERAKEEVRNQINEQLENTTKRTILENERLAAELGYQSRQTEKLLKRQQLLLDEATELRRQLQVSSKTQDAMARRNHTYQKTIKTLLLKVKEEISGKELEMGLVDDLSAQVAALEAELAALQMSLGERCQEARMLRQRMQDAGLPVPASDLDELLGEGAAGAEQAAAVAAAQQHTATASTTPSAVPQAGSGSKASAVASGAGGSRDAASSSGAAAAGSQEAAPLAAEPEQQHGQAAAARAEAAGPTGTSTGSTSGNDRAYSTLTIDPPAAPTGSPQLADSRSPKLRSYKPVYAGISPHGTAKHAKHSSISQQQVQAQALVMLSDCLADIASSTSSTTSPDASTGPVHSSAAPAAAAADNQAAGSKADGDGNPAGAAAASFCDGPTTPPGAPAPAGEPAQLSQLAQQLLAMVQERLTACAAPSPSAAAPSSPSGWQAAAGPGLRHEGSSLLPPIHQANSAARSGAAAQLAGSFSAAALDGAAQQQQVTSESSGEQAGLPHFEHLISKLLSDVRPWGAKQASTSKPPAKRSGASPRKGAIA